MKSATDIPNSADVSDPSRLAIRQMMERSSEWDSPASVPDAPHVQGAKQTPDQAASHAQPPQTASGFPTGKCGFVMQSMLTRACRYRPERKSILWTSLVLMLLLQPFFVFGWSLAVVCFVVALYYFMGADTFWRRVIDGYRKAHRYWPQTARQAKLRAYVFAKKWDRFLNRLPDGMSDQFRVPDLRDVLAADAAHDAAMSDRLTRMDRDPSAR